MYHGTDGRMRFIKRILFSHFFDIIRDPQNGKKGAGQDDFFKDEQNLSSTSGKAELIVRSNYLKSALLAYCPYQACLLFQWDIFTSKLGLCSVYLIYVIYHCSGCGSIG